MQIVLSAVRVVFSLALLLYASWSDYKTREVTNKVWMVYAPIALGLTMTELLLYETTNLYLFGASFGLTAIFSIILFYTGAFGGADSKALICIALALPFSPSILLTPLLPGGASPLLQLIFPLTILSNGVLFAAATGIYMLFRNLILGRGKRGKLFEGTLAKESIGKKFLVLITGYRFPVAKLKEKWHIFPMEDIEVNAESSVRKLVILPREDGRDAIVERLSAAVKDGKISDKVWATPGLPMLIFITAGLIIALIFGDIVWLIISSLFG